MSKIVSKHHHFHWIHLIAVFILGGYFVLSKVNLVNALTRETVIASFCNYIYLEYFSLAYFCFFSLMRNFFLLQKIWKEKSLKMKKIFKKYLHHGKVIGTFVIGAIGGPVFSSLTARLLLNNYPFKYLLIILANIPSTIFTVGIARGLIQVFNF